MTAKLIIFDLDGTLANNQHRQHFLETYGPRAVKDWGAFSANCDKDIPIQPVIDCLYALQDAGFNIEIWTGRTAAVIDKTKMWLGENFLGDIPLRMRPVGDFDGDVELKQGWLDAAPVRPYMAFDDRSRIVKMWRRNGIQCMQVAEGDF